MKCLVTGSTGFVGYNLCLHLQESEHDVLCLVRKTSNTTKLEALSNIEILSYDTYKDVSNMMSKSKIDVVFHIASMSVARHKPEEITPMIDSNLTFPTILLEAMCDANIRNFVNIGTAWQNPYSADYAPTCLYAATKQAFCDLLEFYTRHKGINATTLKLFDTYGPDDTRPKIMNLLRRAAQTGETLNMSPGEQRLDFVHIDDVVRAITMAGEHLYNSIPLEKEYAVCTRKPISLRELVALIEDKTGKKLNINWGALPYRDGEIMMPWTEGKWVPGWLPSINLANELESLF